MTVETMKATDALADRENGKLLREVIIYESGNPVLKVESGTTLKVLKLLYGAEHEKKRQILGVRPKSIEGGIPCIVTLDESKLSDISYDILVSDDSKENKDAITEDGITTNRCIDCSRESWKTKRFTNVGMNTEVSVNPGTDLDLSKVTTNGQQTQSNNQPNAHHEKPVFPTKNNPQQHSPPSAPPRGTGLSFMPQKDYQVSHPKASSHNGGPPHQQEDGERLHNDRLVSSPTYGVDVYNNHRSTQIRYPSLEPPPVHYERFVQSHAWMVDRPTGRYDQSRSPHRDAPSPASRRSPVHRSRSPHSPRGAEMRAEYVPHSHYHAFHEKYRPVLLPANYLHGRRGAREGRGSVAAHFEGGPEAAEKGETGFLRKEVSLREPASHPPPGGEFHSNDKIHRSQPGDEPPVFVLPNDYDVVSGIDPRLASMQVKRSGKYSPTSTEKESITREDDKSTKENGGDKDVKAEYPNSPNGGSKEGFSPKAVNNNNTISAGAESPDSSTSNTQKLYCKICSGVFPTKSLLYKHLRGHTSDEKPFKCNECGQGFTLSSNLRQHRIIHRGYKPFQCEFCGKKFMRSNVYKQHRRIHTGEEMHKCGLCPSEFLQKYALLKHMKKNHDIDALDN